MTEAADEASIHPDEPAVAWRPAVWGPLVLLTGHALFAFFFNPIAGNGPDSEAIGGLLIGVLFSQPMVCAWWAAWSPTPLVWRAPTGIAACVLLLIMASLREWDMMLAVLYAALGMTYWGLFILLKRRTAWRLKCGGSPSESGDRAAETQFGLRYMVAWTTLVAGLCALAKAVPVSSSRSVDGVWEVVVFATVFTMLVIPSPSVAHVLLNRTLSPRRGVGLTILFVSCVIAASVVVVQLQKGAGLGETIFMFSCFSLGSVIGATASALVLRWSGYRMVRVAPGGGNTDQH